MDIFKASHPYKLNRRYLFRYTVLFLIICSLSFGLLFLLNGRSFMWTVDAYEQHYMAFVYIGRLGRSFLHDLFAEHRLSFLMWENGIGYGGDVLTTFTTYLGDPFNWISVLFPSACSEAGYNLMVLLKLWCCGLSFSCYALCRGSSEESSLAGAVTYSLCGTAFISFFSHNFVNPMLIFPLLIIGADRLFEENRSGLYVFSLFWAFVSYFYFAYMMCLLLLIYCVIKLFFTPGLLKRPAEILRLIGLFLSRSVLSAALASFTLVPTLLVLSKMNRLQLEHYLPVFYSKAFYGSMFAGFTDASLMMGRDCMIGFGSFSLICIFALFLHRSFQTQLKAEFLLGICGLCIPFAGHVMNGFSYMANRWVWAFALIVAEIVTVSIGLLKNLSRRRAAAIFAASLVYALVLFLYFQRTAPRNRCAVFLLLCFSVLSFFFPKMSERVFHRIIFCALAISLAVPGFFYFSPAGSNLIKESRRFGTSYPDAVYGSGKAVLDLLDPPSETVRAEISIPGAPRNASWLSKRSCFDFYISMYNGDIDRFHERLGLHSSCMNFSYKGLGKRSELAALLGTGHFITAEDSPVSAPYRYDQEELSPGSRGCRSRTRTEQASLFYLFDHGVSADDAAALSPEEYQQLIMRYCVVPDEYADTNLTAVVLSEDELPSEICPQESIQWNPSENTFRVLNKNSELVLNFEATDSSEFYLLLDDVSYVSGETQYFPLSATAYLDDEKISELSGSAEGSTPYSHLHGGIRKWLIHLGYTEHAVNNIRLCFQKPGLYDIGTIKVYARKKQDLDTTHLLLNSSIQNASYDTNHFSFDVHTDYPQYLFMSIPGPAGWTCSDNGETLSLIPADEAFMAVMLEPGDHHLGLYYRTPGLLPGLLLSLISLLSVICLLRRQRRKTLT